MQITPVKSVVQDKIELELNSVTKHGDYAEIAHEVNNAVYFNVQCVIEFAIEDEALFIIEDTLMQIVPVRSEVQAKVHAAIMSGIRAKVCTELGYEAESKVWAKVQAKVEARVEDEVWGEVRAEIRNELWFNVRREVGSKVNTAAQSQVQFAVESLCVKEA